MIEKPLVGYVVVEADYEEGRDRPIHSFVSSPFATRERAEQERDERKKAYREFCEEQGEETYDEKDFAITELKVHGLNQLQPMDDDRYETMRDAVNAVGAGLVADELEVE